ncbi:preprotein translocase subunit YajC [Halomonas beimenensis]|uniref:Preprotein translocase subunit YajC n=1 Tax=Halomonas beimenensis TaxID=475662 RepID=A0A291P4U7_9GAMM|nr:preprotein translocase subunit YajC [Halomonas beimenensis]ATJ81907.1 hypothetical protein BEI_0920 [Halomonas beimenensis]
MVWLIILVAVGLVFAPAMWLRPSARQQRVMRLRDAASRTGVRVRLEPSPLHNDGDRMSAYRWPYPAQRPGPDFMLVHDDQASVALKPFVEGWRWRKEPLQTLPASLRERFAALLAELPSDAVAVESNAEALTLWWDESLEPTVFAPLAGDLAELRDGLAGRPDRPTARPPLQGP